MPWHYKDNQVSILLLITTITSIVILKSYLQQKRKKKQDEEQTTEFLKCQCLDDFEQLAKKRMKTHRFSYYDYKSGQGLTFKAIRQYFDTKLQILPRALIDVSQISLKTELFGLTYECPIIIAPSAFHCLAHVDGEVATARGATQAQCIYTYNWMFSTMPEEQVLQTTGPKFLHMYLTAPTELLHSIVAQAETKGYRAIVLTCDHPTDRVRDHFLPIFEEAAKTTDMDLMKSIPLPNLNQPNLITKQNEPTGSITWNNVQALRSLTRLPIICKGILSPVDAQLAIEHGADAILVSNHGGRQVDTAPPAIQCLQDIVRAVDGRAHVFIDTGIRSGTDILKCLALGAQAIFIGRPALYGLACGGDQGVQKFLDREVGVFERSLHHLRGRSLLSVVPGDQNIDYLYEIRVQLCPWSTQDGFNQIR